jgi:hypothetical protein
MLPLLLFMEVKKNGTLAVEGSPAQGTYIVEHTVSLLGRPGGLPGGPLGGWSGGAPGVQISSASYGLNAVPRQFVLPLEAAQKGPFFRTPVLESRDPL